GYGDKYIVTDLRQRSKKEPGEVKSLTKFQFSKFKNAPELFEPVVSVSPSLFDVYFVFKGINNDIVYFGKEFSDNYNADFILKDYVINKSERLVTLNFARYKAYGTDGVSIVSVWSFSISCPVCNIITAYSSKIDAYFGLIEFAEGLIAVLKNVQSKLRSNSKDYKTLQHQIERWQDAANQYADSLGAPGDTYIITDTRTRARKDLEDTAALKKYDIRKFSGEELQRMQTDDPLLYEQIKSDLGKTANNALYNNLEILDFRGMQPTYRILSDYSQFFAPADNRTDFAGFGLDDTKQLIADTCRRYYKECEAIAKHLKADTVLQSCFNLWHWMQNNIRYEYDAAGKEEIRTPRRVWADRHRGVDCDCLSTFAWCVLKCMGYDPVFELAAFKNKPAFSHIYVVCDGVVVDRVWFVFNSRPPGITKREIFVVKNLQNLGQLF
ncbi:MAG: hypothetical protein UIG59_06490, partial [Acutalibacteraceae bacterium]|nr:hypothetical protein [Acutalibacteraceae bacterium]